MECRIAMENDAAPEALQAVVDGLVDFNLGFAPDMERAPLRIMLRAEDDRLVGGLLGATYWGWLRVDILWIQEAARGRRYGERMLRDAEEEAVRRGCHHAFLDTFSWQARPFYEKQGYTVVGELDEFPVGHKRYFMQKMLI